MLRHSLRRAQNVHWQALDVTRRPMPRSRCSSPRCCGSPAFRLGQVDHRQSGREEAHALGKHTFLLDGDNVRHGLNKDLGFSDADRIENIRRVGEVAKLMTDAGLIVLTAFISPFRAERELVRGLLPAGEFIEVFIDTPLEEAEKRDVKGLYKKARSGELKNFTGIDSPYERPENPEIRVDTRRETPEEAAERIVERVIGAWMPVIWTHQRGMNDGRCGTGALLAQEAGRILMDLRATGTHEGKALGRRAMPWPMLS
jgi:bifunctional enzyme CysN/CysC